MPKELFFAAFEEVTPNFFNNTWHLPGATDAAGFATLPYWQAIARQLDAGGFDFLFLAETLGYPMRDDGTVPESVIREAVQFPVHDPIAVAAALAGTVDRLGLVVTASTASQIPYTHARTFTTLDHLTNGRIGWNIVTTDMQLALAKMLGVPPTPHDERYARAQEFTEIALELWESAWDDDAVRIDKAGLVYADPAKVHRITRDGQYFQLDGFFPAIPSIQRTPVLFQAGTSRRGKSFAAGYAEAIFTTNREIPKAAKQIAELRRLAAEHGRRLTILNNVSVVVGDTHEDAVEERRIVSDAVSYDAAATLFLGWTGVDLAAYDPETPLASIHSDASQATFDLWKDNPLTPTIGRLVEHVASEAGGFKVTGTAEEVATQLEEIAAGGDLDGFMIERLLGGTENYRRLIDEVFPILRERGSLPAQPRGGTLRERLTGSPMPRLPAEHPGAKYRAE